MRYKVIYSRNLPATGKCENEKLASDSIIDNL